MAYASVGTEGAVVGWGVEVGWRATPLVGVVVSDGWVEGSRMMDSDGVTVQDGNLAKKGSGEGSPCLET